MNEWIKLEHDTLNKSEIQTIIDAGIRLKDPRHAVIGALVTFWTWADRNCVDARTHLTERGLNRILHAENFSQALLKAGWLEKAADGTLNIVNYDRHISASAKLRARKAREKANLRAQKEETNVSTGRRQEGDTEETRRRPKKKNTPLPPTPRTPEGGAGAGESSKNAAPLMTPEQRAAFEKSIEAPEEKGAQNA